MRVVVLHNDVPEDALPEDQDTLVQVATVCQSLARSGHVATTLSCTLDLAKLYDQLRAAAPDVVFNLVESLADADSLLYLPSAVMDVFGLPYTGSRTETLFLTTHKLLAKERLRRAGLPTADWIEQKPNGDGAFRLANGDGAAGSWILKGVWEQGSRGMEDDAVLAAPKPAEVRQLVAQRAARTGRPCFAERFIAGREFNVAMVTEPNGPRLLAPAEIDFSAFPPDKPHIVGHRAKWQADSFEYHHTPPMLDFGPDDQPLLDELRRLARQCWELFDLRGWARVDFRVDAAGRPWILEVNANPCLSPDAGFLAALQQEGIAFDEAIQRILEDTHD
jgi:D-alanine-D-alanine ligase